MRTIKFRAWDKKDGMFGVDQLSTNNRDVVNRVLHPNGLWYDDCVILQFIGLKDKNDKDIYEGDIIHFNGNYCEGKFLGERNAIIEWNEYECCFYLKCNDGDLDISCHHDWEVIGNIWENGDLIDSVTKE